MGSPSTTLSAASSNNMKPAPPASTTPASFKTGNRSGVRSSDNRPASRAARNVAPSVAPDAADALAASLASRTTVKIVPSIGLSTAWYAEADAALRASANSVAVLPALAESLPDSPRRICDKMTPELPRAPMSDPCEMAWQVGSIPGPAWSSSATTASRVRAMLVPVSPSGTG